MPELTMKEEAEDKEDGHERNNMLHDSNDIHIYYLIVNVPEDKENELRLEVRLQDKNDSVELLV
jgi:hypothetical protein